MFKPGDKIVRTQPDGGTTLTVGNTYVVVKTSNIGPVPIVYMLNDFGEEDYYHPGNFELLSVLNLKRDFDKLVKE
jgi:hypothetical protein